MLEVRRSWGSGEMVDKEWGWLISLGRVERCWNILGMMVGYVADRGWVRVIETGVDW